MQIFTDIVKEEMLICGVNMKEKLFKDKELEKKFWKTINKINEETFRLAGIKVKGKKRK